MEMARGRVEGEAAGPAQAARPQVDVGDGRGIEASGRIGLDTNDPWLGRVQHEHDAASRIDRHPLRITKVEAQSVAAHERGGVEVATGIGAYLEQPVSVVEEQQPVMAGVEGDVGRILDRGGDACRACSVRHRRELERRQPDDVRVRWAGPRPRPDDVEGLGGGGEGQTGRRVDAGPVVLKRPSLPNGARAGLLTRRVRSGGCRHDRDSEDDRCGDERERTYARCIAMRSHAIARTRHTAARASAAGLPLGQASSSSPARPPGLAAAVTTWKGRAKP